MRRVARHLFTILSALSLLLCAAVCVLWVRGRNGSDHGDWSYYRYLPDRSAASNQVHLGSDKRRLWLSVNWGRVGPYNGNLVYGYYVNADQSGGRPRFTFGHHHYKPEGSFGDIDPFFGTSGWGPLRWRSFSRNTPAPPGERFRLIDIGVSHWLVALLLIVPPMVWLNRSRKARRARSLGLCPACGYDLRASPGRCPECGLAAKLSTGPFVQ